MEEARLPVLAMIRPLVLLPEAKCVPTVDAALHRALCASFEHCWEDCGRSSISGPAGLARCKFVSPTVLLGATGLGQGLQRVQPPWVTSDLPFFLQKLIPKIEFLDLSHNGVLVVDNLQVTSGSQSCLQVLPVGVGRVVVPWGLKRKGRGCQLPSGLPTVRRVTADLVPRTRDVEPVLLGP